ncbi:MAG: hypothetical protein ACI4K7_12525 [Oscillospiraceae bacterium]
MSNINIGDKVVMNDKYHVSEANKGKIFTVCSKPWECCGTMVIRLEGIRGGYAMDGLTVVERRSDNG